MEINTESSEPALLMLPILKNWDKKLSWELQTLVCFKPSQFGTYQLTRITKIGEVMLM